MANILLVFGSRNIYDWYKPTQLYHIFDNLSYTHDVRFEKVIHGGAKGVDQIGGEWAKSKGYEVEVFAPDWSTGKGAGFVRNIQMLHSCTHAIGVWDGSSNGTKHTMDNALAMRIPTAMFFVGYPA